MEQYNWQITLMAPSDVLRLVKDLPKRRIPKGSEALLCRHYLMGMPTTPIILQGNNDGFTVLDGAVRLKAYKDFESGQFAVDVSNSSKVELVYFKQLTPEMFEAWVKPKLQVYIVNAKDLTANLRIELDRNLAFTHMV